MKAAAVLAFGITAILVGCGGGGSGATDSTTSSTATTTSTTITTTVATTTTTTRPMTIPKGAPTAGNSSTYAVIVTAGGIPSTFPFTLAYTAVNPDGTKVEIASYGNGAPVFTYQMDSDFGITSLTNTAGTSCAYSPRSIGATYPLTLGQSWDNSYTSACTTNGATTITQIRNAGSMAAVEMVATPAGTFTAGKEVFTLTSTITGSSTTVSSQTCWHDVSTGRLLKCNVSNTITPVSGTVSTSSSTYSLIGYVSGTGASLPTAARFAGQWTGSFSGSDSGTCSSVTVSDTGTVTGSCFASSVGTFTINGTVSASGAASFTATTGAVFTGTISSPISGGGTWFRPINGATGIWIATHH